MYQFFISTIMIISILIKVTYFGGVFMDTGVLKAVSNIGTPVVYIDII